MNGKDEAEGIPGIDAPAVTAWLAERVRVAPPLRFERIVGGLSNLTFRVTDETGRRWVLRRPPLGHVLATAHDMGREARILTALAPTPVPVPPVVDLCSDDAVNGAPSYVMDRVDGIVASSSAAAEPRDAAARRRAGASLIDVLATIHSVDVDDVGLGDLGRREAYVERQLSRWQRQWDATRDVEIPEMDELHHRLTSSVPEQGPATIVHGDYRLDNCLIRTDGTVAAVLDWELCTLGDPMADLGLLFVYWAERGDTFRVNDDAATLLDGFPSRSQLLARYADITGRDTSAIGYHVALGYWKLACILQGVIVRFRQGAMGDGSTEGTLADGPVSRLAVAGLHALDGRFGG
ncbi:MAG: phosphotransferase family protein [Acidimicrobiia bacterium]|nr:phosphotransferase family protein [Acidimicrobiia bacterium]